jgi:hypothetical protein
MRAHHLSLILAIAALPACEAHAQTLPWPTDPPGATPGAGGAPQAAPGAIPGAIAAPGPMPMPMSPMAAPAMGAAPFGAPAAPPQGGTSPCLPEFLKLREDVEKKGLAAKQASEHKATREEMCKYITVYSAAELKWVKYAQNGVATCGVPASVAQELKTIHGHTEETKAKICAVGAAGVVGTPVPPSLSDALGTTRLPVPATTRTRTGTLDTLTGNAIQR